MTAFENLSFEAGDDYGNATGWTWTRGVPFIYTSYATLAGGVSRFEGFEFGWGVDDFVNSIVVPTNASYPLNNPETFEKGWRLPNTPPPDSGHPGNETAVFSLESSAAAEFGTTPQPFDGFESGWQNDAYLWAFPVSGALSAPFADGFESGWNNDAYQWTLGASRAQAFAPGSLPSENFESVSAPQTVVANYTNGIFTTVAVNGIANGALVSIQVGDNSITGSRVPTGVDPTIWYTLVEHSTTQFWIAMSGGPDLTYTDNGVGNLVVVQNPANFWTIVMNP